jgi:hypothetical protein
VHAFHNASIANGTVQVQVAAIADPVLAPSGQKSLSAGTGCGHQWHGAIARECDCSDYIRPP